MNDILTKWNTLPAQVQDVLLNSGKLGLLLLFTLICIRQMHRQMHRQMIYYNLDNCFRLPLFKKNEKKPSQTWLSKSLASGLCISLAIIMNDKLVAVNPHWTYHQYETLVNFWGLMISYLLLIYHIKKIIIVLRELFIIPAFINVIEDKLGGLQHDQSYNKIDKLAINTVYQLTSVIYTSTICFIGLVLVVEFFNLQLISALIRGFLSSSGNLLVALLMLALGMKIYSNQEIDTDSGLQKNHSITIMIGCILGAVAVSKSA